jgi:hypothetical protein
VKGDDCQPPARRQHALGGVQPVLQFVELAVQVDANRLEHLDRRVLVLARDIADRFAHHRRQLERTPKRACSDDRSRDPARAALLAQLVDHVGDLGLVGFVQPLGGCLTFLLHAHVEGPVRLHRKAALGLIELHGGHADIEGHALHRQRVALGQRLLHLGEAPLDQRQPVELRRCRDCVRIAIERIDLRATLDHSARIAARTERAVDMPLAQLDRERIQHFVQQHGRVRRGAHFAPRLARVNSTSSFSIGSTSSAASSTSGFQISKKLPAPENTASVPGNSLAFIA